MSCADVVTSRWPPGPPQVVVGASPRAELDLVQLARARAAQRARLRGARGCQGARGRRVRPPDQPAAGDVGPQHAGLGRGRTAAEEAPGAAGRPAEPDMPHVREREIEHALAHNVIGLALVLLRCRARRVADLRALATDRLRRPAARCCVGRLAAAGVAGSRSAANPTSSGVSKAKRSAPRWTSSPPTTLQAVALLVTALTGMQTGDRARRLEGCRAERHRVSAARWGRYSAAGP